MLSSLAPADHGKPLLQNYIFKKVSSVRLNMNTNNRKKTELFRLNIICNLNKVLRSIEKTPQLSGTITIFTLENHAHVNKQWNLKPKQDKSLFIVRL
jgi:hypothetical protein